MTFEEMERLAVHNAPLPREANQEEMCCFLSLRALYNNYRKGCIQKIEAQKEKRVIKTRYQESVAEHERMFAMFCRQQENIRNSEQHMRELCKKAREGCQANVLLPIALRYISCMTGESNTEKWIWKLMNNPGETTVTLTEIEGANSGST